MRKWMVRVFAVVMLFGLLSVSAQAAGTTIQDQYGQTYAHCAPVCGRAGDAANEAFQFNVERNAQAPAGEEPHDGETPAEETPAPENPFTDVAETSAYCPGILWAVEQGITQGTGDGTTFSPAAPCTRAQIAVFLWRAAGSPEPALTEQQFMDVDDPAAYYYQAIQWAAEMDMEYSGTFSPNQPCTRMEAVYFMWRAAGSPEMDGEPSFTDVVWKETEHGAQPRYREAGDAIVWAMESGVTQGTTATTFSPDRVCTRGEIATFLYRAASGQ